MGCSGIPSPYFSEIFPLSVITTLPRSWLCWITLDVEVPFGSQILLTPWQWPITGEILEGWCCPCKVLPYYILHYQNHYHNIIYIMQTWKMILLFLRTLLHAMFSTCRYLDTVVPSQFLPRFFLVIPSSTPNIHTANSRAGKITVL